MNCLEELSKDNLRSRVSRLKIMRYNKMKILANQQLINTLKNNIQVVLHEHQIPAQQNRIIQQEPNLIDLFSFEQFIFSDYKKFNSIVKETIYSKNEKNLINLDEYLKKLKKKSFDYYLKIVRKHLNSFFEKNKTSVINDFMNKNVKSNFTLEVEMSRLNNNNEKFYINIETKTLLIADDKLKFYKNFCKERIGKIETTELKESGWHFQKINALLIKQAKYQQFKGASYLELPK